MDESTTTGEDISNVIHDLDVQCIFGSICIRTVYITIYIHDCISNAEVSS